MHKQDHGSVVDNSFRHFRFAKMDMRPELRHEKFVAISIFKSKWKEGWSDLHEVQDVHRYLKN